MKKFVWFNNYLPQTLQLPIWFAYFNFVYALLFSNQMGFRIISWSMLILLITALGGFGIANHRLWGYFLSLVMAIFSLGYDIYIYADAGFTPLETLKEMFGPSTMISTILKIAILIALLHPQSRSYVKSRFEKTIP